MQQASKRQGRRAPRISGREEHVAPNDVGVGSNCPFSSAPHSTSHTHQPHKHVSMRAAPSYLFTDLMI